MPFDASDPMLAAEVSVPQTSARAHRLRPLSLGVFHYGGAWKVYREFDRAAAYPSRALAVSVAETLALEAMRDGRKVDLFIQDEAGELRQAALGH